SSADCWPPTPCPPTWRSRASHCCPAFPRATWSPRSRAAAWDSTWLPRAFAGSIDIRSQQGQGLTIELRFQASLVATHALFVRDGGQVFGIASHTVRRAVPAVAVTLVREAGQLVARVDDGDYPAHELATLTGLAAASAPERRNLVVVDSEVGPLGLLVDAILDAGELVTRPAGRYL